MRRNSVLDICKGVAIILMVIGHCETPQWLVSFLYLFHMPIFFMAAGYFFSRRSLADPWSFCIKRFKGLYIPFVKWSIFFLIIHNLLFKFNILNEMYGNWEGGVTHPYTWNQAFQRLVHIIFSMGGYDEFMAGAFWFFRALLVSSIVFLVLYYVLDNRCKWLRGNRVVALIAVGALLFAWFKIANRLTIATVVQGGIRETWGVFFFAAGVLFRRVENWILKNWWVVFFCIAVLAIGTYYKWAGMNLSPKVQDVLTLPLTGVCGFTMTFLFASLIDRRDLVGKRFLSHCGQMSIYIYVFHIAAFKLASLVKIVYYGLPFEQIGSHMVIHEHLHDSFWILYTVCGVGLPLLWMYCYRAVANQRRVQQSR